MDPGARERAHGQHRSAEGARRAGRAGRDDGRRGVSAVAERVGAELSPAPSLAVPTTLPVASLSTSSIRRFARCPEDWRRHYVEREPEVVRASMLAGHAYGAAIGAAYWARINGAGELAAHDADDLLVSEFAAEVAEAREAGTLAAGEDPAGALEGARAPLRGYLREVAPAVEEPRAIERALRAQFPGAQWSFVGYLDVDCAAVVLDEKLSGSNKWSQRSADRDPQAGFYLLLRSLAGEAAERFEFHVARPGREEIRVISTARTPAQLAHLQAQIALVARRIARAHASGDWGYGTEGWWCSAKWCAGWRRCPAGGGLGLDAENGNDR
ncbi:MAG: hypothetical protein GEU88_18825 [Solirubrobacterales bacterium]|nr:hypothetical protein [Solirubrobacterales bacterium]